MVFFMASLSQEKQSFAYSPTTGIYLTLFTQWAMDNRHRSAARYFVAFCWMAFVASNVDFGINLYLMIKGFWYSLPQGGPDMFFEDVSNWQTILKESTSQLLVTAGDSLMVMSFLVIPITSLILFRSIAYTASGAAISTSPSSPSAFSSQQP